MDTSLPSRFYAMQVTRRSPQTLDAIEFFNITSGFGRLADATLFATPQPMIGEVIWIEEGRLLGALLSMLTTQDDATAIADFDILELADDSALPGVYTQPMSCSSCGKEWLAHIAWPSDIVPCPRCKTRAEADPSARKWNGPNSPILRLLWEMLPEPDGMEIELGRSLTILQTIGGCVIVTPEGCRIISHLSDGTLTVILTEPTHKDSTSITIHMSSEQRSER